MMLEVLHVGAFLLFLFISVTIYATRQRIRTNRTESIDSSYRPALKQCLGARVLYFDDRQVQGGGCDHEEKHNAKWRKALTSGRIEAGSIEDFTITVNGSQPDVVLTVRWDCGERRHYSHNRGGWKRLRILHLAATGTSLR